MLEILNYKVYDLEESVAAARNSMLLVANAYDGDPVSKETQRNHTVAARLAKMGGGSGESNFRKGIRVSFNVRYPQYWSIEAERYHFLDIICSTSKMHRLTKMNISESVNEYVDQHVIDVLNDKIAEYNDHLDRLARMAANAQAASAKDHERTKELFMRIISNTPMGLELEMRVSTNYEQLATIYRQRRHHRLMDWQVFCDWIERLPYAKELITCQE